MTDNEWDRRRAVTGLVEIARDAIQTARALIPERCFELESALYAAQCDLKTAEERAALMREWPSSEEK
jgi:hypothetical protein